MIGCLDFFFFALALLLSTLRLLLTSSSLSWSNFNFAVLMRECLRKDSCMSSRFPIGILRYGNGSRMHVILNCEPLEEVDCLKYLGSQVAAE